MSSLGCLLDLFLTSVFKAMPFALRQKDETNEPQRQHHSQECFCVILENWEHLCILSSLGDCRKLLLNPITSRQLTCTARDALTSFSVPFPWHFTFVSKPKAVKLWVTLRIGLAIAKTVAAWPLLWLTLLKPLIQPAFCVHLQIIP